MIRRGVVKGVPWFVVWGWDGNKVSHIYSTLHLGCHYDSEISQLRVLANHKTNFESLIQGAWELDGLPFGRYHFLMTLACLAISSKKKCV